MDLDSFQVDGVGMYARTLPLPSAWTSLTGQLGNFLYVPWTVSDDTGRMAFHIGGDSAGVPCASGVKQLLPYGQGTIGLTFDRGDSTTWRQTGRILSLLDSNGTGMVLDIDTLSDGSIDNLLKASDTGRLSTTADTTMIQPSGWNTTQVQTWYFTWTGSRITVRNSAGWSGSINRTFRTVPILTIRMETNSTTAFVNHLLQVRLYSPP